MPDFHVAALTFSLALTVSLLLTPVVIRLSWGILALDRPDVRKAHPHPVPRLGGVAVIAGFASGVGLSLWLSGYSGKLIGALQYHWIGWIIAIAALFVCGVVDDLRGLGVGAKLAVQVAAGCVVYAAGFRIDFVRLPGNGVVDLTAFALPLTLLWIVGVTNAVNLIDGLDGLATGIGLIMTLTMVAISYYGGVFPVTVISLALAGSLLGFLPYNFSPARIFLGDSGSQFLGFTLAVISIRGLQKSATAVAILAPILVLGLPILDSVLVVLRRSWRIHGSPGVRGSLTSRLARSRGLFQADREHIHHNLLDLGLSDRKAVAILYLAAGIFCASAFALVALRAPSLALIVASAVALLTTLVKLYAVRRRSAEPATERSGGGPTEPTVLPRALEETAGARPGQAGGAGSC